LGKIEVFTQGVAVVLFAVVLFSLRLGLAAVRGFAAFPYRATPPPRFWAVGVRGCGIAF
jgi:hypothetical protein